jgi:hypothetical protein
MQAVLDHQQFSFGICTPGLAIVNSLTKKDKVVLPLPIFHQQHGRILMSQG